MEFAQTLIRWQKTHGRHDLPWQRTHDPYPLWVSEIMLQQTQVATVIPYFQRFMARFPDLATLAHASEDDVLRCWSGLGYYARGRNLHRAAREVAERHGGRFPHRIEQIAALPGVGRSTAAAIAVFAFGQRAAILDGNVKRVLTRVFAIEGWPGEKPVERRLWQLAEALLPQNDVATYTQALMDLGATVCTRRRPACARCPLERACRARLAGSTDRLPSPRPRKTLPEQHTQMLVIRHRHRVLLERRPPAGIWGGLWSLPQCSIEAPADAACHSLTGTAPARIEALPAFTHAFTHLRLHIQPREILLDPRSAPILASERTWMALDEALRAALPKPVARILQDLASP